MTMNRNLFVTIVTLTSITLAGYALAHSVIGANRTEPQAVHTKPSIDYTPLRVFQPNIKRLYQGNSSSRTWVVFDPDDHHLVIGDAFRIQNIANGEKIRLVPLRLFGERLGYESGNSTILTLYEAEKPYYCGKIVIPTSSDSNHEPTHVIFIRVSDDEPDVFDIEFEENLVDDQCLSNQHHGGTAHVEN
jgi:hypothetical protein